MIKKQLRRFVPLCILFLAVFTFVASAQESRTLSPGTAISSTFDADNFIQVFTIDVQAGQALTVSATNAIGIPLALVITDASGNTLSQIADADVDGEVSLSDVVADQTGTYYVTVFKAAGVGSVSQLDFTLLAELTDVAQVTLEAVATTTIQATALPTNAPETTDPAIMAEVPAETVSQLITTQGMTINLSWTTTDDLDLEIRDPIGGSLYFQTPTVPSGGTLGPNINQGCAATTTNATETAVWSPGGVPTGSYEILVYFQQDCDDPGPVSFTITPIVDGVILGDINGSLLSGQIFVTSFRVNGDGTSANSGISGVVEDEVLPDTAANVLAAATPITVGQAVSGTITSDDPYDAYSFTVESNDIVTITQTASSGSLDTFLLLLDSQGNIIRSNDDLADGITNSQISSALLTTPGTYTIVATRYGKRAGGTEGDYALTLSAQATNLPEEFINLTRGSLEFTLVWDTDDDLQLLVRDPAGDAVYDDQPTIRSGGQIAAQGNLNCVPATTSRPFSYIYWPQQILPRPGVYEIEVWFQSECTATEPVNFNLFATYNGQEVFNVTAQPILNERYLISFTLEADGSTTLSDGGIIRGLETLPYQAEIENAGVLQAGAVINGSITQDNKFDLYVFNADAGDLVTISMNRTSGTLDPTLYLVGPFGNIVAENDDAVVGENTNSLIANLTLPETGQYIIIATHFGALYGGTTGTYSVSLTQLN